MAQKKIDILAPPVSRPKSKRGRKPIVKPELENLAKVWESIPLNEDRGVPGTIGMHTHEELTLARYHLKKNLAKYGITKDQYETFYLEEGGLGFRRLS